jgi:hypothetical protein
VDGVGVQGGGSRPAHPGESWSKHRSAPYLSSEDRPARD